MIASLLLTNLVVAVHDTVVAAAPVASETAHEAEKPYIPNFLTFINKGFAEHYEVLFFALFVALIMVIGSLIVYRKRQMIPGPFQNAVEMLFDGLYSLVYTMLGKETDRYIPFVGTLFIYIWFMNLSGLIPFLHSPTSALNMTASLAITVFLYVQYTAVTRQGPLRYVYHLAGDPNSGMTWALVIINLPLHVVSEFIKPASLAMRLFGNIMGEDTLIAVMIGLGVSVLASFGSPVGIPFQLPFYFLALLLSTIQAVVFTMLSSAYIMMALPHTEH